MNGSAGRPGRFGRARSSGSCIVIGTACKRGGLLRLALVLAGSLLSAGCGSSLPVLGSVPDFTLTSQDGTPFGRKDLLGKVWVADFLFTNCQGPCPRMARQMKQVQDAVQGYDDVRLVSMTIDPDRDTPPVLAAYAHRQQARPGTWYFLTGPRDRLHQLNRHAFLLGNVDGSLEHSTRFVLLDRESRIRAYYLTDEPDAIDRLVRDLRELRRAWR